jgi:hypothetical protein
MRRCLLILVVAALAAGTAGGSSAKPEHEPLLGLMRGTSSSWLIHFDRDTLEPVGARLALGHIADFAYDSNGWLAYADIRRLRIVDPEAMKPVSSFPLWAGRPVAVAWFKWETIIAVNGTSVAEVRAIQWGSGKVRRTARVKGVVVTQARGDNELVLLLAPEVDIGPARLLVIDPEGHARLIAVPRISVGSHFDESTSPPTGESRMPALALDAAHDLAYVVGDGLVAEVPLAGTASYHALGGSFSKMIAGTWHSAAMLPDGTLAIAGSASPDGRVGAPTGLEFVDTHTWRMRRVDAGIASVERWQDLVLATGVTQGEGETVNGTGLVAFDTAGNERFRVFAGQPVWLGLTTTTRAYVHLYPSSSAAVELPTGRVVAQHERSLPYLLTMR